jgi:osmotically-inducible protein OsmY
MYPTLVQADDEELKKRILIALQSHGIDCLHDAQVQVSGGVVVLSGNYASAYDQRLAFECCRHVAGVLRIKDLTKSESELLAAS